MTISKKFFNKQFVQTAFTIAASVLAVAGLVYAATTIGTNISVDGNLTVNGTNATTTFSTGGLTVGTSQFVVQQTSGNVGIGTTSPAGLLAVHGDAFFGTSGASTLTYNAGSFNFVQSATSTIPSSTNAWSIATSSSAMPILSVTGSSGTSFGQVGIDTIPSYGRQLTVGGLNPNLLVRDNSTTTESFLIQSSTDGTDRIVFFGLGGVVRYDLGLEPEFGAVNNFALRNETLGQTIFAVSGATGNFGIGTTTPWGLLSVNPNALAAGTPQFVVGSSTQTSFVITNSGNVGIGTAGPGATFDLFGVQGTDLARLHDPYNTAGYLVSGYTAADQAVVGPYRAGWRQLTLNGSPILLQQGNVGIGTTSPAQLLSVAGDAYIAGTGTTTLNLKTTTASKGTCIEMFDSGGSVRRLYINAAGAITVEAGTCK